MTIAVDLGRKATKQKNRTEYSLAGMFIRRPSKSSRNELDLENIAVRGLINIQNHLAEIVIG